MPNVSRHIYNPFSLLVFFIILILVILFVIVFFGLVGTAFEILGFSTLDVVLLLLATLIGSFINIPLFSLTSDEPVVTDAYVTVFGITYRVPTAIEGSRKTVVAVNVGGALIPIAVSLYLLWRFPETIGFAVLGVTLVAIVSRLIARPVRGVGIVSPGLVAPVVAAIFALVMSTQVSSVNVFTLAYVSGVLGTLIGADLANLNAIKGLGAPVASIGGAGTFDGVFLSGIMAILIAILFT
ncbi:MAG: DUF1614 domain-containing protein [Halobacteriota archaeon]